MSLLFLSLLLITQISFAKDGKYLYLLDSTEACPKRSDFINRNPNLRSDSEVLSIIFVNKKPHSTSDFWAKTYARRLIARGDYVNALHLLENLPMWFSKKSTEFEQIFWTENHAIQYMSTEFLLREFYQSNPNGAKTVVDNHNISAQLVSRLGYYFQTYALEGFAEPISPVYAPYTFAALLNLYDLACNQDIKNMAEKALNDFAELLMKFTLQNKEVVSPTTRTKEVYANGSSFKLETIVEYIFERMEGKNISDKGITANGEIMTTGSWIPAQRVYDVYDKFTQFNGKIVLSTSWKDVKSIVDEMLLDSYVGNTGAMNTLWIYAHMFEPEYCRQSYEFIKKWGTQFDLPDDIQKYLVNVDMFCIATEASKNTALGYQYTDMVSTIHKTNDVLIALCPEWHTGVVRYTSLIWVIYIGVKVTDWVGDAASAKLVPKMSLEQNILSLVYLNNVTINDFYWPFDKTELAAPYPPQTYFGKVGEFKEIYLHINGKEVNITVDEKKNQRVMSRDEHI